MENKTGTSSEASAKAGKYFKYAIGEIILVVIGILIALQINNWNESKKQLKQEHKLLLQLSSDLNKNKHEVVDLKNRLEVNKLAMDSLLGKLEVGTYHSMIPFYVAFTQRKSYFNNASSSFNMLKNGMASNITNDSILKNVLDLYENDFVNLTLREQEMHSQIDDIQKTFVNKLFKPMKNKMQFKLEEFDEVPTDLFEPLNFHELSKNHEYINNLYQLKKSSERRLAFIEKTAFKIDSTLTRLRKELENK